MNELIPKRILILLVAVPLALYAGFRLVDHQSLESLGFFVGLGLLLATPILLKFHQPLLIFSWNSALWLGFLPGKPPLWMAMAVFSFGAIILHWIIVKHGRLVVVPSINRVLLFLLAIILVTVALRGGVALRSLGGSGGGKKFVFMVMAVMGYFALSLIRIPPERVPRYLALFFLSGLTYMIGNLVVWLGADFFWLFWLFTYDYAVSQFSAEFTGSELVRLGGFSAAMQFAFYFILARYPIRELFSLKRPWMPLLLAVVVAISSLGGFRGAVAHMFLLFAVKFYLERLLWTRLFYALIVTALLVFACLYPFTDRLPYSVQRVISFLPVNVEMSVRSDAEGSTLWRIEMWKMVWESVPDYLWVGKGYKIDLEDAYWAEQAQLRGWGSNFESFIVTGDYHSGPLSVLVNFGIPGAIGMVALWGVGVVALARNYRYGNAAHRNLNQFLLALFCVKIAIFLFVFGDFASDLLFFTGALGFSVAVNGGMLRYPADSRSRSSDSMPVVQTAPSGPLVPQR